MAGDEANAPQNSREKAEQRATEHQVLGWCHEGLAFVEAGLVPEDFKQPLLELMEERLSRLAGLEDPQFEDHGQEGEGEFVE